MARLGGDEFVVILPAGSREQVDALCQQLIAQLNLPFPVYDNDIHIGGSLGIALAPQDADNASDLLRFADIALYKAKTAAATSGYFSTVTWKRKAAARNGA